MTEQNKPTPEEQQIDPLALPMPACTYADHSYPAFTAKQMKEYAELYAAAKQNKQPPAEAGEGAVNKKYQLMRDACNAYIQPKGNMESRESSVIRKFKTRMEWENICHPWSILELLDELSELKTSQTTATQAAVAAMMMKCAEICKPRSRLELDNDYDVGYLHAMQYCQRTVLSSIPAEATAALDAYVQEKCVQVAVEIMGQVECNERAGVGSSECINFRAIVTSVIEKGK
jgi:hypothetical protein